MNQASFLLFHRQGIRLSGEYYSNFLPDRAEIPAAPKAGKSPGRLEAGWDSIPFTALRMPRPDSSG